MDGMAEECKPWLVSWLDARDGPNTKDAIVLDLSEKADADEMEARELRNRAAELQRNAKVARGICEILAAREASSSASNS